MFRIEGSACISHRGGACALRYRLPYRLRLSAGKLQNWRVSMTIVAALLSISVGCYMFGVLYSPWGKDYRTEKQAAPAPPDDEVSVEATPGVDLPCRSQHAACSAIIMGEVTDTEREAYLDAVGSLMPECP